MSGPLGFSRELGGIVQLRMKDEDWELLEVALRVAAIEAPSGSLRSRIVKLESTLNAGNPEFVACAEGSCG